MPSLRDLNDSLECDELSKIPSRRDSTGFITELFRKLQSHTAKVYYPI